MPDLPQIPLWAGIPLFLAILVLLVMIHELGHFITAKLGKVTVEEFAFGFPPRMLSVTYKGTDYSINWLPIGGYVKMLGEEDPSDPGSLASKPAWLRLIIMGAGSFMNFVLAVVLFAVVAMWPTDTLQGRVVIGEVAPDSPAAAAGFLPGDVVTRVNERVVASSADLQKFVQLNLGSETQVEVERGNRDRTTLTVTPRWAPPEGQGPLGVRISLANARVSQVSYGPLESIGIGFQQAFDTLTLTKNGLIQAFAGNRINQAVTGPVGMYQLTEAVTQASVSQGTIVPILTLMAFISMSLAIFNILPIPALDGGRMLFVVIEILRGGRRIAPEREAIVHVVGFAMLIGLIVVVSFSDITRIIAGESLIR
jgi:regulator of sigma E protease